MNCPYVLKNRIILKAHIFPVRILGLYIYLYYSLNILHHDAMHTPPVLPHRITNKGTRQMDNVCLPTGEKHTIPGRQKWNEYSSSRNNFETTNKKSSIVVIRFGRGSEMRAKYGKVNNLILQIACVFFFYRFLHWISWTKKIRFIRIFRSSQCRQKRCRWRIVCADGFISTPV